MFLKQIDRFTDFRDILLQFSTNNIKELIDDSNIFARGNSYNKRDYVSNVIQTEENRVKAKVLGSSNNHYEVDIYRIGGSLHAECDCPYGDVCKHISATLIHITQTKTLEVPMVLSHQDKVLEHLKTLSNSELIELVTEFAPDSFIKEIILNDAPVEELDVRINEIACAIKIDINDEDLLYNPEQFQKSISVYIENLKPFVNKSCDDVFEIIFDLAEEIEDKQEEGYLYIDHYYDESYFDFKTFASEIMALISKIEDNKKQLDIFIEFAEICSGSGYMRFNYNDLEISDKKVLLEYFNSDSSLDFYYFIEEFLSFEEREKFLLEHNSYIVFNLLVNLYLESDKKELAIDYIEKLIKEKFDLDYIEKLLEIREISKDRLREFVIQAIQNGSYKSLDFILKNISKIDGRDEVEKLLKDKSLDDYYRLLKQEDRVSEMFELLDDLPSKRESFLKKYKYQYKSEAIAFFRAEIKENLKSTGNDYYQNIADALAHLKELIDSDEFALMVENFKRDYKRRKNFVAILNKRF